jgi:hypothetical protein
MADIDKLRAEYEHAEEKAQRLQADKDDALQKVMDKYRDKMRDANQRLADAQKALADAEAAAALIGRDDAEEKATTLGLLEAFRMVDPRNDAIIARNTSDGETDWSAVESEIAERETAE